MRSRVDFSWEFLMKLKLSELRIPYGWIWSVGLLVTAGAAFLTHGRWWPQAVSLVQTTINGRKSVSVLDEHDHGAGGDAGADHAGHAGHDDASALELSQQALGNLGLTPEFIRPVRLSTYRRTVTLPAMATARPGRTRLEVSTPMAGVITHVHAVQGEAVPAGSLLFELRITAAELVATQTELLKSVGELDVENREIARLKEVTSGAVPQRALLERQYAKDKIEVLISAQKEALRLQGISERQIEEIVQERRLLRDLRIVAPSPDEHSHDELELVKHAIVPAVYAHPSAVAETTESQAGRGEGREPHHLSSTVDQEAPLILQDVLVHKGDTVAAGARLAVIDNLNELYIEGRAFEQDADLLTHAAAKGWQVTAVFERAGGQVETVEGLEFLYSASEIDPDSRTLRFYVRLPNQISRRVPSPNGHEFVEWKYRPGQRLQLRVPVEEWEQQIVLPVDAVAQEGVEAFVFLQNGGHFDRKAVQVVYRDQDSVVIKNDGTLFAGDVVAMRGAHQMQMALKNKSGGGVDPHAGHNH
ncbi:MAG: efflux RND transporter periplasmic adaptor subunit [Planctomycetaceae bacterium]